MLLSRGKIFKKGGKCLKNTNFTKRISTFLLSLIVSASLISTSTSAEGFSAKELEKTTAFTVGNEASGVNIEDSIKINKAELNKDKGGVYINWEIVSNTKSEGGGVYTLLNKNNWQYHNWHSILIPDTLKDPVDIKINRNTPKAPLESAGNDLNWENAYRFRKVGDKDFSEDIARFFTKNSGDKQETLSNLAKNSRYMLYGTNLVRGTKGKPVTWTFKTYLKEDFLTDNNNDCVKLAISYAEKFGKERTRVKVVNVKVKNTVKFDKNSKNLGDKDEQIKKFKVLAGQSIANSAETNAKIPQETFKKYIFKGWNTAVDGSGNEFTKDTKIDKDMEVFGKWNMKVTHIFESLTAGKTLPTVFDKLLPKEREISVNKNYVPADLSDVKGSEGTWNFKGWTPKESKEFIGKDGEFKFIGKWSFSSDVFEIEKDGKAPEGYSKVSFKLEKGVKAKDVKTYAVKKGIALAKKYFPNVELEEGYKDLKWTPAQDTAINEDTVFVVIATKKTTIPATELVPSQKKEQPKEKESIPATKLVPSQKKEQPKVKKETNKSKLPQTAVVGSSITLAVVSLLGLGLSKKRR